MIENEARSETVTIGGEEHRLILTTRATKEITKRYGGLEAMGDRLMEGKSVGEMLDEVLWLITLLANQEILIHNLQHSDDRKELLKTEDVELLTSPYELAGYKDAILSAMLKGTKRNIPVPEETKNAQSQAEA